MRNVTRISRTGSSVGKKKKKKRESGVDREHVKRMALGH